MTRTPEETEAEEVENEVERRVRATLEDDGEDPDSDSDHAMYLRQDYRTEVLDERRVGLVVGKEGVKVTKLNSRVAPKEALIEKLASDAFEAGLRCDYLRVPSTISLTQRDRSIVENKRDAIRKALATAAQQDIRVGEVYAGKGCEALFKACKALLAVFEPGASMLSDSLIRVETDAIRAAIKEIEKTQ